MSDLATKEVLWVDDNPLDVELALRTLRKANLAGAVAIARDGVEALEYLLGSEEAGAPPRELALKVIVLDLKMPRIDGLEVLRRIKADPRTRQIPVVVLTSSNEQGDVAECYRLGVNSYIVKPVNSDHFSRLVSEIGSYWLSVNQPPQGQD